MNKTRTRQKTPQPTKQTEWQVCYQVAKYLKQYYPNVLFKINLGDGGKIESGRQKAQQNINPRGLPDLMIFEARDGFHGLMIEIKREGVRLQKKDGTAANDHFKEQMEVLDKLSEKGYKTALCVGLEATVLEINAYLNA